MKKQEAAYSFFLFFLFISQVACKKSSTTRSPFDSKFSFTCNGVKYVLPYKEGWVI